ncbi:MAG: hypothetical protein C0629_07285 [Chromatiales bacterium]|nr:MAG: hypothetical protein C0629_07285 [Chromatiales bacterium]
MKNILLLIGLAMIGTSAHAYPIDGYPHTQIRRLDYCTAAQAGEVSGCRLAEGATLSTEYVQPRLLGSDRPFEFEPDQAYGESLAVIVGEDGDRYGIALLDLTDHDNPIYAEHNGGIRENVGSVGKMLVGLAFFQELANAYPDDPQARHELLKNTWITGDEFVISDHHKALFWNVETREREYRQVQVGDRGSLYDWLDWMLSASNNAAAATMQKQLILLAHFGAEYPVDAEREAEFFAANKASALGKIYLEAMNEAVVRNGLDPDLIRQGSFFTRTGKNRVAGTTSYGNPRELVHFLYLLEQGRLVDEYSSTELKRLLYMTQRRIRYASHPALYSYAVYFKSGSLYSCQPEPDFVCKQYQGNKRNQLASLAIVEGPMDSLDYHYLVVVSSNVLYKNSAVEHQTLAMRIQRMIEARHAARIGAEKAAAALAPAVSGSVSPSGEDIGSMPLYEREEDARPGAIQPD